VDISQLSSGANCLIDTNVFLYLIISANELNLNVP